MEHIKLTHRAIAITIAVIFSLATTLYTQGIKKTTIPWKGITVDVVEGQIGLKVKTGTAASALTRSVESLGFIVLDSPDDMGMSRLQIPKTMNIIEAIEKVRQTNLIEGADPIIITYASVTPNDQYYSNQWGLPKINAPLAWDITNGSSSIIIGILDSGIPIQNNSLSHPDLQNSNRIILGNDYIGDGEGVRDRLGHGTHVAGIASAETNNSIGVAGVSWNTKLFIVQVFDDSGRGTDYTFYQGVRNAVDNGAKVINFSGGGMSSSYYFEQAIIYARNNDRLIVASAGNYHQTINPNKIVKWPAAYSTTYDNVIAVSATNSSDVIAAFSSRGPAVNVASPGEGIYSTMPNYYVTLNGQGYSQNYSNMNGTSMAAPHVAGTAALLLSINQNLTPSQIRNILQQTADDKGPSGFDTLYGYGRINANKAVRTLFVPQVYPTIAQALSIARSGQYVMVAPGNYSITGNLTIGTGIGLIFYPGSTVTFNGYYRILVRGWLDAAQTTFRGNGLAGSWFGIEAYNANARIGSCTIRDASYALYANNSSVLFSGIRIENNSFGLLYDHTSSPIRGQNLFQNNYMGIWLMFYSDPRVGPNNVIRYNSLYSGICIDVNSNPELSGYEGAGENSLYGNSPYGIKSDASWMINASGNWWRGEEPSVYGNVDPYPVLYYNPNGWEDSAPSSISYTPSFGNEEFNASTNDLQVDEPTRIEGKRRKFNASTNDLQTVGELATLTQARSSLKEGNIAEATRLLRLLISSRDSELRKRVLFDLGMIAWYWQRNTQEAALHFNKLVKAYPDHPLSKSAQVTLIEFAPAKFVSGGAVQDEFYIRNYPNPFNPVTKISYALPEPGYITLKVYDVLGREVAVLVDGWKEAGRYEVEWNGENFSSGVYFYKLSANEYVSVKKMLLAK